MDCVKIGKTIKKYRLEKGLTQSQLAAMLNISDKTVSKWENGRGCPDISLISELSKHLGAEISSILSPAASSFNKEGNSMKNCNFYVCPICGSVISAIKPVQISCCGHILTALEPKKAQENEKLNVEISDGERYITAEHPMTKDDYISFVALCCGETVSISMQYPEWGLGARFIASGVGKLFWYSEKSGLLYQYV